MKTEEQSNFFLGTVLSEDGIGAFFRLTCWKLKKTSNSHFDKSTPLNPLKLVSDSFHETAVP
jgi:hypothetical protein